MTLDDRVQQIGKILNGLDHGDRYAALMVAVWSEAETTRKPLVMLEYFSQDLLPRYKEAQAMREYLSPPPSSPSSASENTPI